MHGVLVGIHLGIAHATNSPEMTLADEEATGFLIAAQNVMRHYSIEATQRSLDWVAFFGCVAGIYGPRAVAIKVRRMEEKAQASVGANIHNFNQHVG